MLGPPMLPSHPKWQRGAPSLLGVNMLCHGLTIGVGKNKNFSWLDFRLRYNGRRLKAPSPSRVRVSGRSCCMSPRAMDGQRSSFDLATQFTCFQAG